MILDITTKLDTEGLVGFDQDLQLICDLFTDGLVNAMLKKMHIMCKPDPNPKAQELLLKICDSEIEAWKRLKDNLKIEKK